MLSQVEFHVGLYLKIIASNNKGNVSWSVVENFTHSGIFFVVVVRAAIVLGTMPGTLHSIHFAGIGTFSTWLILIKTKGLRWITGGTGNFSVGKTCRLERLILVTFNDQQPNMQSQQALVKARIHSCVCFSVRVSVSVSA